AALAQAVSAAVVTIAAGAASIWALAVAAPGAGGGAADVAWFAVAVLLPMAVFEVFSVVPQAASSWRSVRAAAERIASVVPDSLPPEVRPDAPADSNCAAIGPSTDPKQGAHAPGGSRRRGATSGGGVGMSLSKGPDSHSSTPHVRLRAVRASWPGAAAPALTHVDL